MSSIHDVYLVEYKLGMIDPDRPEEKFHLAIYVDTEMGKSGFLHHVTGNITSTKGMTYTPKSSMYPSGAPSFSSMRKIGVTKSPHAWENALKQVQTPPQQKAFNGKTMKTEPFKTRRPLTFYEPNEARKPLIKCSEWVIERALPFLRQKGLLIDSHEL